ncbi:hypothetical protein PN836_014645 [Ningiella sp. W23]|uniref:hypothetical protein n=1 Tax=Ningiella sp. W23 TaxID=3023715 RepID=UPI0037577DDC
MQLDKLQIDPRPKSSWQCFDLGCRLAVQHFRPLFCFWLLISLPVFGLAFWFSPSIAILIFWLLKPWFERGLLFILSREVFNQRVSILQVLRAWPSQIKARWFASISYARLAPSRSFDAPVAQLEKLTGEKRSKRLSVLHQSKDDNSGWWTICCVHWELFLLISILVLAQMMLPTEFEGVTLQDFFPLQISYQIQAVYATSVYISAALVAPFYVAGGFVAYLNRRVILEGWDIELSFKKWAASTTDKNKASAQIVVGAKSTAPKTTLNSVLPALVSLSSAIVLSIAVLIPTAASAQSFGDEDRVKEPELSTPASSEPSPSKRFISSDDLSRFDNLSKEEFGEWHPQNIDQNLSQVLGEAPFEQRSDHTVTRYRWKVDEVEEETPTMPDDDFLNFLKWLVASFEVIFWVLFALAFAYLIYSNRALFAHLKRASQDTLAIVDMPSFVGSSIDEPLPDDIGSHAQYAIDNGDYRLAMSILLRASLSELALSGVKITASMTEQECIYQIKQSCTLDLSNTMRALIEAWSRLAWAHQNPTSGDMQAMLEAYKRIFIKQSSDQHTLDESRESALANAEAQS